MKVTLKQITNKYDYENSGFQEAFIEKLNAKFFNDSNLPKYKTLRLFKDLGDKQVVVSRSPIDIYNMSMYKALPKRCFTVTRSGYEYSKHKHLNEVRNGTIVLFLIDGKVPHSAMKNKILPNVIARLKIQSYLNEDNALFRINKCGSGSVTDDFLKYATHLTKLLNKNVISGNIYRLPKDMDAEGPRSSMFINDISDFTKYIEMLHTDKAKEQGYPEFGHDIRTADMLRKVKEKLLSNNITDREFTFLSISILRSIDISEVGNLVIDEYIHTKRPKASIIRMGILKNPYVTSEIIDAIIQTVPDYNLVVDTINTRKASTKLLTSIVRAIRKGEVPIRFVSKKINTRLYGNLITIIEQII